VVAQTPRAPGPLTLGAAILGVAASYAVSAVAGWPTHVSLLSIALAVIVSVVVGLAFGVYPAIRAARLQPVDALRYE
jgi:putative ABC transport system permease protein